MDTDTRKSYEFALNALDSDCAAIGLFKGDRMLVGIIKKADELDPDSLVLARLGGRQQSAYNEERDFWDDFSQFAYENMKVIERQIIPMAKKIFKTALGI